MIIKIKFDLTPQISQGEICDFIHKSENLEFFKARFVGHSRIDGLPLFDILTKAKDPILSYDLSYKSFLFKMESSDLISVLEDHYKNYNERYHNNTLELLELSRKIFDITEEDLQDNNKFRTKLRNIKLAEILK